jgi:hypothetical protein
MADDSPPDLSTFPSDISVPSNLTADQVSGALDTGVQFTPFPFCLLFASRPWQTITVAAPSPEAAASTTDQFVQRLNGTLASLGYPPNVCTWNSGACG